MARSPQGVGEPAACALLFDASTSQSGRAVRLPRDRRGGPFPSAARGRRGAEPAVSLGAQRPRRRRRQAGAAAAQAPGQPSAHPRRLCCGELGGAREPRHRSGQSKMAGILAWFWNERFWLPHNVTWADLKNTEEATFPQAEDLYLAFPVAFCIFMVRLIFER